MDRYYIRGIALAHMNEIMNKMWVHSYEEADVEKAVIFKREDGNIDVLRVPIHAYIPFSSTDNFEVSVRCRDVHDYLTADEGLDDMTLYNVKNSILDEINLRLDEVSKTAKYILDVEEIDTLSVFSKADKMTFKSLGDALDWVFAQLSPDSETICLEFDNSKIDIYYEGTVLIARFRKVE
jgi:hypothetical protein